MEYLVHIVGADPPEVVDPYDLDELMKSGNLENELSNGIDYFVEADPIQYMSRVQLRGSQMPPYFPGKSGQSSFVLLVLIRLFTRFNELSLLHLSGYIRH